MAEPKKNAGIASDKGFLVPEKARHYAAVAKFPSVLDPSGKDLVIQCVHSLRLAHPHCCFRSLQLSRCCFEFM